MSEAPNDTLVSGSHRVIGGRYVLERQLGKGGMGTVWRASQLGVGNTVAIKFLNEVLSSDPGVVKRFEQEAKVSLEVTHPGASQLLDTGRDPTSGQLYIVFEFVDGEDLRTRLTTDGALPFEEARDITLRVGEVLAAAHARGVVHRDIKPENIRLRRDLGGTHVKVLDFGIASFRPEGQGRLTAEGAIAGTPAYMAPEQVRAERVDGRADIYALGLVAFEMMTGTPAFLSSSAAALLVDQLSTPLPTVDERAPGRGFAELDALLQRACAKDPAHRFQSAKDFVDAVKALPDPSWAARPSGALPVVPRRATSVVAPPAAPSSKVVGVVAALIAIAAVTAIAGFVATRPADATCSPIEDYPPELRSLPVAELEKSIGRLVMPSAAARELETIRHTVSTEPHASRECRHRVMLLSALTAAQMTANTSSEAWAQSRDVAALERLFLELPLLHRWTIAQRRDVLAQIDASLTERQPPAEDLAWWRRHEYGVALRCFVDDESLEQLKARRPPSCPALEPR